MKRILLFSLLFIFVYIDAFSQAQLCPSSVPFQVADLRGNPDSVWTSLAVQRAGACCGDNNCIEIILFLDPGAQGIKLDFDPSFPQAVPNGSLTVDINCVSFVFRTGSTINPICLSGTGPFHLVYCKPGNNLNRFIITSIPKPSVSPPTVVSDGCTGVVSATGYQESTITWRSVPNNPVNDSYLSATSGTDTVVVSFLPGAPAFVDYEVCGTPLNACVGTIICDTVRVQFVSTLEADIQPKNATICFGSVGTTLTANGVGGLAPYTYLWNTGATTQSIIAATAGTYSVTIDDATSCPIARDTVVVTDFPSTILANAGLDRIECNNSSPFAVQLNGSVQAATGGIWSSTGAGTFSPNNTTLNANYLPSAAEITAGSVLLTLTTTGNGTCPADTDQVFIRISNAPIVDAGNPQTVCANNANVVLNGSVSGLTTTGTWTSSGTGTFSPNANTLNATYIPSAADRLAAGVTLTLTSTNNGICTAVTDNVFITIQPAPIVNAGANINVCANNANVNLNGSVTGVVTTTGIWTSTGTGSFSPNATTLNAIYIPSAADISNGTVNLILSATNFGNCIVVRDTTLVTITGSPVVSAGANISRCVNNLGTITLAGSISGGASQGIWTSTNGTGTFSPNSTTLNANYVPSAADLLAGTITLILSSTNHGLNGCLIVRDTMLISFTPSPIVNAGADVTVCANNININLNGSISAGASTGIWASNGSGSFVPNNTTLNASYVPSIADINAGLPIRIILTSTNNTGAICNTVSDTLFINITPSPIVNAGANFTVCASNPTILLSGNVSAGASTGTWTTINGTGSFSNNNLLNPVYTPSNLDISNGTVSFVLNSTDNTAGTCNIVRDTVVVTISPTPTVTTTQSSLTFCRNNIPTINVVANFGGAATGVAWSSTGTGTFTNSNASSTVYQPSLADINSNSNILLIVTTTGNASGLCTAISDTIILNFTPAPIVSAGTNITVCANNIPSGVQLNASVSGGASAGSWTSSGTGTFSPSANVTNAIYNPSLADITAGSITLTFTSTNHGLNSCTVVSSQITLTINPTPIVDAGINQTICANRASNIINLNGTVTSGAITGIWSTPNGTGTISNTSSLNTTYTLSTADINLTSIKFYLTSTGNSLGTCLAVVDSFTLTITPAPIVNAGANQTLCANNSLVNLSGTVSGGATTGIWTSINGSGTFANATSLTTATYTPSSLDIDNGSVLIVLSSTGNTAGTCVTVRDTLLVSFTAVPIVNAGADFSVCRNNPTINLNANIVNGPGTILWTSNGTGTFNNTNTLNPNYTPSALDLTNGTVTFTISSTAGNCLAVLDQITVTITPSPIVNAGVDITRCKNNIGTITLGGSVAAGASTGIWTSSGTGIFLPNNSTLNAQYVPSQADTAAGTVTLTLTSTGNTNNTCIAVNDALTLTFTPAPRAFAGANRTICANGNLNVSLATASVSGGASTGEWFSDGTGSFSPTTTTINATYTPSAADILKGFVVLKLKTTGNTSGSCRADSSQFTLTISPAPIVDAGNNITVCAVSANVSLNGSVIAGASTGIWTSSGTGTFSPNNTTLNAIYIPSAADKLAGTIRLRLTSTGNTNNTCNAVRDSLTLTILPEAIANAGLDQPVCKIKPTIQLNGSVSGSTTTGIWITNGSGTFSPNANTLNAVYTMSATDTNLTGLNFILNTTNNGTCIGDADTMLVTFSSSDDASFTYSSATYCTTDPTAHTPVIPILATGAGGVFTSTPAGLVLNSTTGAITVLTSTLGTYVVKFVTNGPCPDSATTTVHIINTAPNAVFNLPTNICKSSTNLFPTYPTGGTPGIFTANSANLKFINTNTGEIDLYNSLPGTYIVTNTIPASGTCIGASANQTITIERWVIVDVNPTLRTVCANRANVSLTATFAANSDPSITSGTWKKNGDGVFSNASSLSTTYTPGPLDLAAGTFNVRFVSAKPASVCNADSAIITINVTPAPVVDAGLNDTLCSTNTLLLLNGNVNGGATTGTWTKAGGAGTFLPNANTLNAQYVITAADKLAGSVKLYLTSTGNTNNTCDPVVDSVIYTLQLDPVINAGNDTTVCFQTDTLQLNSTVVGSINTGVWSSTGTGTFIPNTNALNAKYILSANDKSNGSVRLILNSATSTNVCAVVIDTLNITISAGPVANAGANQTVCANNDSVRLTGTLSGTATTAQWSSNGTGTFVNAVNNLTNIYIPSAADETAGSVILSLASTNLSSCSQDTDYVQITITQRPVVNAGTNITACTNNLNIILNGTVSGGATRGRWTSTGTGQFLPHDSSLTVNYIASNADLLLPSINFILTSLGNTNQTCLAVRDTTTLTFNAAPVVNITSFNNICANNIQAVSLAGTLSGSATKIKWSTISGDGTFNNDSVLAGVNYTLGANDISKGFVNVVLRTVDHGTASCLIVSDTVQILITPSPIVNAGIDRQICVGDSVNLNGNVSGANTTGTWTSTGTGIFSPNANTLNARYIPSAADYLLANFRLILRSTNTGNCINISDTLVVTNLPVPTVNASINQTVCADVDSIQLNGNVSGTSTTGIWTSSGTGLFSPNASTLNARYIPSQADRLLNSILLSLTSTNGPSQCLNSIDTMRVFISPDIIIDAGTSGTVCVNNSNITLNASVSGGSTTGTWKTSGTGTFLSGINSINNIYQPSNADLTFGNVILTLVATNIGTCKPDSDQVQFTFTPAPFVDAGANQSICENEQTVNLTGIVNAGATKGRWTSNGDGMFVPNDSALNALYQLGVNDNLLGTVKLFLTSTDNTNGTCSSIRDSLTVSILPTVNITQQDTVEVCANNANVILNPTIVGTTNGILWTTNGSGSFIPSNTIANPTYVPSNSDTSNGNVILTLTIGNVGGCLNTIDTLRVLISDAPIVNAGNNIVACVNKDTVTLIGQVSAGAQTGIWSSTGSGQFLPNNTNLNSTYILSNADKLLGNISIILTSTGNSAGSCLANADTINININTLPVVNILDDTIEVCANNASANITSNITGSASTGIWTSSGTGVFSPNNTVLNPIYTPSTADISIGNVLLTLRTTNHQSFNCNPVSDSVRIIINPSPLIVAIDTIETCITENSVTVSAQITQGAITGQWMSLGSGTFNPSNNNLTTNYIPSAQDKLNGTVKLVINSTGNTSNLCLAESDTITIVFTPFIFVDAGDTMLVCKNNFNINLNGSVTGGTTSGIWTSNGTGVFLPNNTTLNAVYVMSTADTAMNNLQLKLISTENGGCDSSESNLIINFSEAPTVFAGPDITVCDNSGIVTLTGVIKNGASAGIWTSTGTGAFLPNNTTLNAVYQPSSADFAAGNITLRLTSSNHNTNLCLVEFDELNIELYQSATVNGGPDRYVCYGDSTTTLFASANGANPFRYFWSTGDTTQSIVVKPGTYVVRIQDINDCIPQFDTIEVIGVDTIVMARAGNDSLICVSTDSIQLNGNVLGLGLGHWEGDGVFLPDSSALNAIYIPTSTEKQNGSFSLILRPSTISGCTFINDTVQFNFVSKPSLNVSGQTTVCLLDDTVNYSVISTAGETYLWQVTGGNIIGVNNSNSVNVSWGATGGTLTLIANSAGNCDTVINTVITNVGMTLPSINGVNSVCNASAFIQNYNVTQNIGNTYTWQITNGQILSGQNTNDVQVEWNGSGTLVLIETGNLGCEVRDTFLFNYTPLLASVVQPLNAQGCAPLTINFDANSANTGALTHQWIVNQTDTLFTRSGQFNFDTPGVYTIKYILNNGTCTDTITTTVTAFDDPIADFNFINAPESKLIYPFDTLYLQNLSSILNAEYLWDFGDGNTDTVANPIHEYIEAGTYQVQLRVTDTVTGCISYFSRPFTLEVISNINSPQIFTPNGDGINDNFKIYERNLRNFKIVIFNRWGQIIYTSTDPNFEWDGTHEGRECQVGAYVYHIIAIGEDNLDYKKTDIVNLVR